MTPQQFRKKPVVIDAMQFTESPGNVTEIFDWSDEHGQQITYHCDNGEACSQDAHQLKIPTLEGAMFASRGDWIIRGTQGEFYPCKPDAFAATFEEV